MKIVVDAGGGDFAPLEILKGVKEAASSEYSLILIGPREKLLPYCDTLEMDEADYPIVDAPQIIEMDEHPAESIRRKPNSSIILGIRLLAEEKADAFISAGNSGAFMAGAWLGLSRIGEIERPAIAALIPNSHSYTVLLDVGANMDCKPKHLLHFGVMGAEYAKIVLGTDRPRVGLLSIGEEEGKGNEAVKSAYGLFKSRLKQLHFEFTGNAEGQDVVAGNVDVVVCDGFTGNALLKFGEGLIELIACSVTEQVRGTAVESRLETVWKKLDRSEYGGALLLGVEGICLVCHGKSRSRDIKSAILSAKELIRQKIALRIRSGLSNLNL